MENVTSLIECRKNTERPQTGCETDINNSHSFCAFCPFMNQTRHRLTRTVNRQCLSVWVPAAWTEPGPGHRRGTRSSALGCSPLSCVSADSWVWDAATAPPSSRPAHLWKDREDQHGQRSQQTASTHTLRRPWWVDTDSMDSTRRPTDDSFLHTAADEAGHSLASARLRMS